MKTFEETIDALTDVQRALIASALDAFDSTLPVDAEGVCIEDVDDGALGWLIGQADALDEQTETAAALAGVKAAEQFYLAPTGNPAQPHTMRTLLRVRGVAEL